MVQKNAASLIHAMGLQDEGIITSTILEYKAKAIELATNTQARRQLAQRIKEQRFVLVIPHHTWWGLT